MSDEKNFQDGTERGAGAAPEGAAAQPEPGAGEPSAAERVQQLEAELAELRDRSLRALADAENTRRRAQREIMDYLGWLLEDLTLELSRSL